VELLSIGIGVIGYGKQGASHARNVGKHDGFRLVAVCDPTEASRDQAQADHPDVRVYDDVEKILGDADVDLVIIVTPTTAHAPLSIKSMESGKHVVCEKPMCMNFQEAVRIRDVSRATQRYFCVYQNRRGDDYYTKAKAAVDQGKIGRLRDFKIIRNRWGVGAMVWGSDRFRPQWRSERAFGGGMLYDWGGHWIDQALLLHGGAVKSVYAQLFVGHLVEGQDAEDGFRVLLGFEDGAAAHIEFQAGALGHLDSGGWVLSGTHGGYSPGKLFQLSDPAQPLGSEMQELPWEIEPPSFDFWGKMRRAITSGEADQLPVPVEESLRVMRIIDAAFESADQGRAVTFDPAI